MKTGGSDGAASVESGTHVNGYVAETFPPWCTYNQHSYELYFYNTTSSSECGKVDPLGKSRPCVCFVGSTCAYVNGLQVNRAPCVCGTAICEPDVLCDAALSTCMPVQNCSINNGSNANVYSCHCGAATCDASTGLICYSTVGGGSCRKTDPGPFGYTKAAVDFCYSVPGRSLIPDKASCEAAANSMGLSGRA